MKIKVQRQDKPIHKTQASTFAEHLEKLGGTLTVHRAPDGYIAHWEKDGTLRRGSAFGIGDTALAAIANMQAKWWGKYAPPANEYVTKLPLGNFEFEE